MHFKNLEALVSFKAISKQSQENDDHTQQETDKQTTQQVITFLNHKQHGNLVKLREKYQFWQEQLPKSQSENQSEITHSEIRENFILIADCLNEKFPDDANVNSITKNMLLDENSPFYKSLLPYATDKKLISFMSNYILHIATLLKLIEETDELSPQGKEIILDKVRLNLSIFPGDKSENQTEIDFFCADGTQNRLNDAITKLKTHPLHIQAISDVADDCLFSLIPKARDANKVHIRPTIYSMISLEKTDDGSFRGPDTEITLMQTLNFQRTFKEKVLKNIEKRLDEYSERFIRDDFNQLNNSIKMIDEELGINLGNIHAFFLEKDLWQDDMILLKPISPESREEIKEEIKELFKPKFQEIFPSVYLGDKEALKKDAFDYLTELDIYKNENRNFLDSNKMDNLLNLLTPEANDENRNQKIKAGLLVLHSLARSFKDSDPMFFLVLLDKLEERTSSLENYQDSLPSELKQEDCDASKIIDYVKAKRHENKRSLFEPTYSYEDHKKIYLDQSIVLHKKPEEIAPNMLQQGRPYPYILSTLWTKSLTLNNFDIFKNIFIRGGKRLDDRIMEKIFDGKKNNFLKELLSDADIKLTDEALVKIFKYATDSKELELALLVHEKISSALDSTAIIKKNKDTLLHIACEKGDLESVKLLIEKGADVNSEINGLTPFNIALNIHKTKIVKALLDGGVEASSIDENGKSLLINACEKGNVEIVKMLIAKGAEPNIDLGNGETLLSLVCEKGNVEIARTLINAGLDVNYSHPNGHSLLHKACINRDIEIVKILIEKGADVNVQTASGLTPMDIALFINEDKEVVKALLDGGVDANRVKGETTLLNFACKKGNVEIVKILIEKGANINEEREAGQPSTLDILKTSFAPDIVQQFVEISKSHNAGKTPATDPRQISKSYKDHIR
jgi:ankyrin repeat protein